MIALACRTMLVFTILLGGLTLLGFAQPPSVLAGWQKTAR